METIAYRQGARGFVVGRLQRALGIGDDGDFGPATARAVNAARRNAGAGETGEADATVFGGVGAAWPSDFERLLCVIDAFEGTGFSKAEGPAQTGDSAGVTYGIVGFTSGNGELQGLLRTARQVIDRARWDDLIAAAGLNGDEARSLDFAINAAVASGELGRWALTSEGSVRGPVKAWLGLLGREGLMQGIQVGRARLDYFTRSERQALALFGAGAGLRARGLVLDVSVQNGGLRDAEMASLVGSAGIGEAAAMTAVLAVLLERMKMEGRPQNLIEDVRERKRCWIDGEGVVHGDAIKLAAFAA